MPSPILHIGLHKTGTTWFQNRFWPRVENVVYLDRHRVTEWIVEPRAFEFDAGEIRNRLPEPGPGGLVLCEEELSGNIHAGGWRGLATETMARRLHAMCPDARVVVFIRRQPEMIASVYGQYLRMGGTYGPGTYLHPRGFNGNAVPLFSFAHFEYHRLLNCYADLFGRERLYIYPFEAFLQDRHRFIEQFSGDLDLQVDPAALDFDAALPGYSRLTLAAARLFNLFTRERLAFKYYFCHLPGLYDRSRRWLNSLNRISRSGRRPSPEDLLGDAEVRAINRRFAASNRALAVRFDLDLDRYGYPLSGGGDPPEHTWSDQ